MNGGKRHKTKGDEVNPYGRYRTLKHSKETLRKPKVRTARTEKRVSTQQINHMNLEQKRILFRHFRILSVCI